jgi:hypothetical protein
MNRNCPWVLQKTAWSLLIILAIPLFTAGCGGGGGRSIPPPVDDSRSGNRQGPLGAPVAEGMSTGRKMVMLAGAAALYYMYKRQQSATGDGPNGQYYLSKNGRVYYRDAEHRAHWVTPPPGGIRVSENEARGLENFQGYNNRSNGRNLSDVAESRY